MHPDSLYAVILSDKTTFYAIANSVEAALQKYLAATPSAADSIVTVSFVSSNLLT